MKNINDAYAALDAAQQQKVMDYIDSLLSKRGRQMPEMGDRYHYHADDGMMDECDWRADQCDYWRWSQGNVFLTREECEADDAHIRRAAEVEIQDWLAANDFDGKFVAGKDNWFPVWNYDARKWELASHITIKSSPYNFQDIPDYDRFVAECEKQIRILLGVK
jgi:hypothetical protein